MSWMRRLETAQRSRLAWPVAVVLGLALLVTSEGGHERAMAFIADREALLAARVEVGRLVHEVLASESSQRGYLLTGRQAYKEPYLEASAQVETQLVLIARLYRNWPERRDDVQRLDELTRRRMSELNTTIRLFEQGKGDGWRELVLSDIGHESMQAIEGQAHDMARIETERIALSERQLAHTLMFSRIGIAGLVVVSLFGLLLYARQTRRLDAERGERAAALRSERDRLENEVERRTIELTQIATHLQTAREDERSSLARELHDELGGLLTAAKLDVARMRSRLASAPPEVSERMKHLVKTLDEGIALKRRIIEDLRPSSLNNLGLKAALEVLCADFAARSDSAIHVELEDLPLDETAQLTVYRLVQEALTNVAKHASARTVFITAQVRDGSAWIEIRDDGIGFDPASTPHDAHGLAGMRFRIRSGRGDIDLHTAPGQGTVIRASLPLHSPSRSPAHTPAPDENA